MNKLFSLTIILFISLGFYAQEKVYSDEKVNIKMYVEKIQDEQNDVFYEYYAFEVTNISDEEITFNPIISYKSDSGELKSSASHDELPMITLAPKETAKGSPNEVQNLILFKQFLIGKNGTRASLSKNGFESISINY